MAHRLPFFYAQSDNAIDPGQVSVTVARLAEDIRLSYPETAVALRRLVTSRKGRFTWRTPSEDPYLMRDEIRRTVESR